jgi:surface antigen
VSNRVSRQCYSGRFIAGLWEPAASARRIGCIILVTALPWATAACSLSYKLDSLFGTDKDSGSADASRSTAEMAARRTGATFGATDADLALAKAAASEAMTRTGKDVSVPWENPATGAHGTVTAVAAAYGHNGATCREFLASYVRDANETWLRGQACQIEDGRWEVRNLKPWKRS